MPNNGRVTLCPYYHYERKTKIVCEDVPHRFRLMKHKDKWMDKYCDAKWQDCMWAKELTRIYEEEEDMKQHIIDALKKELHKAETLLGRAEKRIEPKDEEIKKLRKKNQGLEEKLQKMHECEKREAEAYDRLLKMSAFYESRFAYLMSEYAGGSFRESDAEAWGQSNMYRIEADIVDGDRVWKAVTKGDKDERGASHGDQADADHEEEQPKDRDETLSVEGEVSSDHHTE